MSFAAKKRLQATITAEVGRTPPQDWGMEARGAEARMETYLAGKFLNIEHLFLRWKGENWFEYLPHPDPLLRFAFRRYTGETVTPGRMFTNGGSIPRWLWWKEGLSPWDYGPAYVLHDWEFDLHYCGQSQKTFEQVRDEMMEALRTLMDEGLGTDRPAMFRAIYVGINSSIARQAWASTPGCTLPEDGD